MYKDLGSCSAKPTVDAKDKQEQPQVMAFQRRRDDTGRRREGDETRLALIDARTLVRVAMSNFLQAWAPAKEHAGNFLVLPFSSPNEFLNRCPDPSCHIDMVALNIGSASIRDERVQDDVRQLRDHLSNLPLVLMSDQVEPWSGLEAVHRGVNGYIPTSLSPSVAIQAIRLVHAGGTFVPSDLLLHDIAEQNRAPLKRPDTLPINGLTARQLAVLELIRQGRPNKLIAAELNISDSTVKVYVRQIMKRLGAINRTHACYLLTQSSHDDKN